MHDLYSPEFLNYTAIGQIHLAKEHFTKENRFGWNPCKLSATDHINRALSIDRIFNPASDSPSDMIVFKENVCLV